MDGFTFNMRTVLGGFLIILTSRCLFSTALPVNSAPRIGIIGGGIGGATTAYFIRTLFGTEAKIDVFEKSRVGGRLSLIEVGEQKFEAGGSIIHDRNRYMADIVKFAKLKRTTNPSGRFAIYDGKEFVFEESSFSYMTYVDLIWRYGLSIVKWNRLIDEMLNHFDNVYSFQDEGYAYTTVDQLLRAMDPEFVNMTQATTSKLLQEKGFSDKFIEELAMAALRVNYGQTTDANGFVGALSLAAAQPTLWSVEGGNYQLAEAALNLSNANLILEEASVITLLNGGKYKITTNNVDNSNKVQDEKKYDIVIVSAPQTKDLRSISFNGFSDDIEKYFSGHYHQTVATFVEGTINSSNFGFRFPSAIPDDIIAININVSFNSVGRNYPVNQKLNLDNNNNNNNNNKLRKVYKIFSQKPMTNEQLDDLFKERTVTKFVDWLAYPQYTPPEKLGDFKINGFLYYTSAIEWAGSAMEMSAVSARNAALLAYNEYNDINKIDQIYTPKNIKTEL